MKIKKKLNSHNKKQLLLLKRARDRMKKKKI